MIIQIIEQIKSGIPIEQAIPEGADPVFWQRLVDSYQPNARPKRRIPNRRAGSSSRRTNYAAQVIGRSMAALVERVNSQEDDEQIFFSGPEWIEDETTDDNGARLVDDEWCAYLDGQLIGSGFDSEQAAWAAYAATCDEIAERFRVDMSMTGLDGDWQSAHPAMDYGLQVPL